MENLFDLVRSSDFLGRGRIVDVETRDAVSWVAVVVVLFGVGSCSWGAAAAASDSLTFVVEALLSCCLNRVPTSTLCRLKLPSFLLFAGRSLQDRPVIVKTARYGS